jgi:hypothetical protein
MTTQNAAKEHIDKIIEDVAQGKSINIDWSTFDDLALGYTSKQVENLNDIFCRQADNPNLFLALQKEDAGLMSKLTYILGKLINAEVKRRREANAK